MTHGGKERSLATQWSRNEVVPQFGGRICLHTQWVIFRDNGHGMGPSTLWDHSSQRASRSLLSHDDGAIVWHSGGRSSSNNTVITATADNFATAAFWDG